MAAGDESAQAHVIVRGRVQGVYFRGSLKQQADTRGVSGWVRNRADGSVEALVQGPRDAVSSVVAWMRTGPRGAHVETMDVDWSDAGERLEHFEVVG